MSKSFSYNVATHKMSIARNEIGDFGLHLSLIRSFSWGNNFPTELPFYPGNPLPYHYYFDLIVGLMERTGIPLDLAYNGLSAIAFTALLFFIYKLPQILFGKSRFIGAISVLLFVFHSSLTFIDFLKDQTISLQIFKNIWIIPDYIHKGPFDGSIISTFFTLNVFLNQRHLIAALAISLTICYLLLPLLMKGKSTSCRNLIILGLLLGVSAGIHTLIFFSNIIVWFALFLVFKKKNWILPFFLPALVLALPHIISILHLNVQLISHKYFNPGFLAMKPLAILSLLHFWFSNLGIALILIPLGVLFGKPKQRIIFACFFILFLLANTFQLSFRIDHNHSLINYFLIIANFYIAYFLYRLVKHGFFGLIITALLIIMLTVSGFIDLMAVKNDFQVVIDDAPVNSFMRWIKDNTDKDAIFLARQDILDPITLAGRRNYYGSTYYLSVMGYDYAYRRSMVKTFFDARTIATIEAAKQQGIAYIVLPVKPIADFTYSYDIHNEFFSNNLQKVYSDQSVVVYKL